MSYYEFEEFKQELREELHRKIDNEDIELLEQALMKYNEPTDGLVVKYPDSRISPVINLNEQYQYYVEGVSISEIAGKLASKLWQMERNMPEIPELTAKAARENLYCVIINAVPNKELLKDVPHERFEDLAIIPRFRAREDGSFLVKYDMCSYFHLTPEEVLEIALANTAKQEYICQSMSDVMREMMFDAGFDEEYIAETMIDSEEVQDMYVLTNESKIDGAMAIISSKAMQTAYDKIGTDFYILPSSRHELILVPKSEDIQLKYLEDMVAEVNSSDVINYQDVLSYHVYEYDTQAQKVRRLCSKEDPKVEEAIKQDYRHARSR